MILTKNIMRKMNNGDRFIMFSDDYTQVPLDIKENLSILTGVVMYTKDNYERSEGIVLQVTDRFHKSGHRWVNKCITMMENLKIGGKAIFSDGLHNAGCLSSGLASNLGRGGIIVARKSVFIIDTNRNFYQGVIFTKKGEK